MPESNPARRPVWGASQGKPSSASSAPSTSTASTSSLGSAQTASSSAFPPLSPAQARKPSQRPPLSPFVASPSSSSLISPTSFNPYPTRRQELAQRAASHGTRKRSHITRSDPSASRIHSILDYEDDVDSPMDEDDSDTGEVSTRGATMSSIVFRDLSASAGSSRSASPWQQTGMSAGLAMFATSSFGGEPLRVLANLDEELGAAHMGPRIYKRHNQKHVRNRIKAKLGAAHASTPSQKTGKQVETNVASTPGSVSTGTSTNTSDALRSLDLHLLVERCRRSHNLAAVEGRIGPQGGSAAVADGEGTPEATLLSSVEARIAHPATWSSAPASVEHSILAEDLLPTGLQQPRVVFDVLPRSLLDKVRLAVLRGLGRLLDQVVLAARSELIDVLAQLLLLQPLRPSGVRVTLGDVELTRALQQTFLRVLGVFLLDLESNPATAVELLGDVLARCAALSQTSQTDMLMDTGEEHDVLVGLVGELVGLCGQQMSSNPAVLTAEQDETLVALSRFLSVCFAHNASRRATQRLAVHAFYCTVLDLAPFLEHFVHHAASLARLGPAAPAAEGLAQFNVCRAPFLVSLGAKMRMLQLENEVRLARSSLRSTPLRFGVRGTQTAEAELVLTPGALALKIERAAAWEQSRELLAQLLDSDAGAHAAVRALRVEFAGEQAADGGGPAREWFATAAAGWTDHGRLIGSHGWFLPTTPDDGDDDEGMITAAVLGLLLGLAALHSTKLTLPFRIPAVAWKLARAPDVDAVALLPVDLECVDAALARALQAVLDWQPDGGADAEQSFEATFTLTWSTTISTRQGVRTLDLVPGGRHRAVRLVERRDYVSKLIWRVLVGSARGRVGAFHAAWQAVMPSTPHAACESPSDVLARGGLAVSLFAPSELSEALTATPTAAASRIDPLDVDDLRTSTEVVGPSSGKDAAAVAWLWEVWTQLPPLQQRHMLAFITGAQDVPATGARGVGLRIHLVPTDAADHASWPLPWSSTCTSTLFLPTYPTRALLEHKVGIAIEHFHGFGLR